MLRLMILNVDQTINVETEGHPSPTLETEIIFGTLRDSHWTSTCERYTHYSSWTRRYRSRKDTRSSSCLHSISSFPILHLSASVPCVLWRRGVHRPYHWTVYTIEVIPELVAPIRYARMTVVKVRALEDTPGSHSLHALPFTKPISYYFIYNHNQTNAYFYTCNCCPNHENVSAAVVAPCACKKPSFGIFLSSCSAFIK